MRARKTALSACIVLSAFIASGLIVGLLAPKPEEHPIDLGEIRKIEERTHREKFPQSSQGPYYIIKQRGILNVAP